MNRHLERTALFLSPRNMFVSWLRASLRRNKLGCEFIYSLSCMKKHWNISLHLRITFYYLKISNFPCSGNSLYDWELLGECHHGELPLKGSYFDVDHLITFLKPRTSLSKILMKKTTGKKDSATSCSFRCGQGLSELKWLYWRIRDTVHQNFEWSQFVHRNHCKKKGKEGEMMFLTTHLCPL